MIRRVAIFIMLVLGAGAALWGDPITTYVFVPIGGSWYDPANWTPSPGGGNPGPLRGDGAWIGAGKTVTYAEMGGSWGATWSGAEMVRIDPGGKLIISQDWNGPRSQFDLGTAAGGHGVLINSGLVDVQATLTADNGRITGGGTVTLSDPTYSTLNGGGDLVIDGQTINGTGTLTGFSTVALTPGTSTVIDANRDGRWLELSNNGTVVNGGTLQASGGGLLGIRKTNVNNYSGAIQALDSSQVYIGGGGFGDVTVWGGLLTTEGTGQIVVWNQGVNFFDLTNAGKLVVPDNSATFGGGITNTGTISGAPTSTIFAGAGGAVTFTGGGSIQLDHGYIETSGMTNIGHTISGTGIIGYGSGVLSNGPGGIINASGGELDLRSVNLTNTGTLQASAGASLVLAGGTFDNAGGSIRARDGGTVVLGIDGSGWTYISGGVLTTEGSGQVVLPAGHGVRVSDLTNQGTFRLENGADLHLGGAIDNTGTMVTGTGVRIFAEAGGYTLAGGGTLTLGSGDLYGPLTNQDNLVQGNVVIHGAVTNYGTFWARSGETIGVSDGSFNNQGIFQVDAGGSAWFDWHDGVMANFSGGALTGGSWEIAGTLETNGRAISSNAANIFMDGADAAMRNWGVDALATFSTNTAAGSFTIRDGYDFASQSDFANDGQVTIGAGSAFYAGPDGTAAYAQGPGGRTIIDGALYAETIDAQGTLSGSGAVHGHVTLSGELNPGDSPGTMTIFGDYTQGPTGVLNMEIGPSAWDFLDVNGNVNLAGILNVLAWGAWPGPEQDYQFDILRWTGTRTGSFDIHLPSVSGYTFSTEWGTHDLWVNVSGETTEPTVPEPGTFLLLGAALLLLGRRRARFLSRARRGKP